MISYDITRFPVRAVNALNVACAELFGAPKPALEFLRTYVDFYRSALDAHDITLMTRLVRSRLGEPGFPTPEVVQAFSGVLIHIRMHDNLDPPDMLELLKEFLGHLEKSARGEKVAIYGFEETPEGVSASDLN